tara:strand:- start:433 stop:702 length:270 start_codon:yes stop_codon:yes gene_type:complete
MDVLTSSIIGYAFSPVLWVIKKGTHTAYNYITGRKIITMTDRMIEQQTELNELKTQIKSLTEYIVDNNIHHKSNITLDDYEIVNVDKDS